MLTGLRLERKFGENTMPICGMLLQNDAVLLPPELNVPCLAQVSNASNICGKQSP